MRKLTVSVSFLMAGLVLLCVGAVAGCGDSRVSTVPESERAGLNRPGDPNDTASTHVDEDGNELPGGLCRE